MVITCALKYLRQKIHTKFKNCQLNLFSLSSFSFQTASIILYNKCALHYLSTYANNFIKWLALKVLQNKVSNDKKFVILFVFLYEIYFIFAHFNVNVIKESYITKNSLQKFLLNILQIHEKNK